MHTVQGRGGLACEDGPRNLPKGQRGHRPPSYLSQRLGRNSMLSPVLCVGSSGRISNVVLLTLP